MDDDPQSICVRAFREGLGVRCDPASTIAIGTMRTCVTALRRRLADPSLRQICEGAIFRSDVPFKLVCFQSPVCRHSTGALHFGHTGVPEGTGNFLDTVSS